MDIQVSLFNGFVFGIERRKFAPFWASFDEDGYSIYFHCGIEVNIGFVKIKLGTFFSDDEFVEMIEE